MRTSRARGARLSSACDGARGPRSRYRKTGTSAGDVAVSEYEECADSCGCSVEEGEAEGRRPGEVSGAAVCECGEGSAGQEVGDVVGDDGDEVFYEEEVADSGGYGDT